MAIFLGRLVQLSKIHKPDELDELERIKAFGGVVLPDAYGDLRFLNLNISRSFGQPHLRKYGLIAEPFLSQDQLEPNDNFLLIGSDGLFVISNQEAVDSIKTCKTPQESARKLVDKATVEYQVDDDVTAMVIPLKGWNKLDQSVNYTFFLSQYGLNKLIGQSLDLPSSIYDELAQSLKTRTQIISRLFQLMDINQDGKITPPELKQGFARIGVKLRDDELDTLLLISKLNDKNYLDQKGSKNI